MAERLTDAQLRNQRSQALRALRRAQRKIDTHIEVMERKLDRAIENKELITIRLALGVGKDYIKLAAMVMLYQKEVADAINIFLS